MKTPIRILKFIAGFTANLAIQTLKAAANGAACLSLAVGSAACLALALLQLLGGGRKAARESSSASWSMAAASAKRGLYSILQAAGAVTLLSPLARAAQACSEDLKPNGVFEPAGRGRNMWQEMFGLNSWDAPKERPIELKRVAECDPPRIRAVAASANPPISMEKIREINVEPTTKPKASLKSTEEDWNRLVREYLEAQTQAQMDAARAEMAIMYPRKYSRALVEALAKTRKRAA